jgi:hypothetical protein
MDDETEEGVRLLARLARGDVRRVRGALAAREPEGVDDVIKYSRSHRKEREPA